MGKIRDLPDDEISQRYLDGDSVTEMSKEYNVANGTINRHLRNNGIELDRKIYTLWTEIEERQLIDAHNAGMTGTELWDEVPTRTHVAVKQHLKILGLRKLIGHNRTKTL